MTPKTHVFNGWSDRVKLVAWIVDRIGVTGAICAAILFGCYGLGKILLNDVAVPLVQAHKRFLDQQVVSMEKIVVSQERQSEFWTAVQETHRMQVELLTQNHELIAQGNKQSSANMKILESATDVMRGVPEERKKQTVLLEEIKTAIQAKVP